MPNMNILKHIQSFVPDCTYKVNVGVKSLPESIELYDINLDPDYQRSYVWTLKQNQRFVGALLENHNAIPPFWFNWTNKKLNKGSEIVDGKQRLNAVLKWLNGDFKAICPCGINIHIDDLTDVDKRGLNMVTMQWNFVELSRVDVMKYYIRLNCGGTIHTDAELNKVRKLIKKENA